MRTVNGLSIPAESEIPIAVSWRAKPGNHTISAEINPDTKNYERDPYNNLYIEGDMLNVQALHSPDPGDGSESNLIAYVGVLALTLGIAAFVAHFHSSAKHGGTDEKVRPRVRVAKPPLHHSNTAADPHSRSRSLGHPRSPGRTDPGDVDATEGDDWEYGDESHEWYEDEAAFSEDGEGLSEDEEELSEDEE